MSDERKKNQIKIALRITPDSTLFSDYVIFEGNDVKIHFTSTDETIKEIFSKKQPFPVIVCTPLPNIKFITLAAYLKKINFDKPYEKLPILIDDNIVFANTAVINLVETAIDKVYVKSDTLNIISKHTQILKK